MLVEGQIVDNKVKVLVGMGSIQSLEESQKDMAVVVVHATGLHRSLMHGKSSQETRGAAAGVGCRMPFGVPGSEREFRLSPVQCLYLRFLVHAENQSILRRIQIKTDNSRLFGFKFRIGALAAPMMNLVGFERGSLQNPVNRCGPQTGRASKLPSVPSVRSGKRPLTRQTNHLGTLPRRNACRTPLPGPVVETIQTLGYKALTPLHTIRPVQSALCADLFQR